MIKIKKNIDFIIIGVVTVVTLLITVCNDVPKESCNRPQDSTTYMVENKR